MRWSVLNKLVFRYTMCEPCFTRYKHNKYCPECSLVFAEKDTNDANLLRSCTACRRYVPYHLTWSFIAAHQIISFSALQVHSACDSDFVQAAAPYLCPSCRKKGAKPKPSAVGPEDTKRKAGGPAKSSDADNDAMEEKVEEEENPQAHKRMRKEKAEMNTKEETSA